MHRSLSTLLIILGIAAIVVGLALRTRALAWFGNLPGDIRYVSGNVKVFFPITSMLILSFVISLLLWLARRWL